MKQQDFHSLKMTLHFIQKDEPEKAERELKKISDQGLELLGRAMKQRKEKEARP